MMEMAKVKVKADRKGIEKEKHKKEEEITLKKKR